MSSQIIRVMRNSGNLVGNLANTPVFRLCRGPTAQTSCRLSYSMRECLPSSGQFREKFRNAKGDSSTGRITSFNKLNRENTYYKIFFSFYRHVKPFSPPFPFPRKKKWKQNNGPLFFLKRVSFSLCRK